MRNLPEVEFITVREDAYQRAEELASLRASALQSQSRTMAMSLP